MMRLNGGFRSSEGMGGGGNGLVVMPYPLIWGYCPVKLTDLDEWRLVVSENGCQPREEVE